MSAESRQVGRLRETGWVSDKREQWGLWQSGDSCPVQRGSCCSLQLTVPCGKPVPSFLCSFKTSSYTHQEKNSGSAEKTNPLGTYEIHLKLQTEWLGCVLFVDQPHSSVGESILNPFKSVLTSKPAVTLDYLNCHFITFSFQHPEGLAYFILRIGWVSSSLLGLSSFCFLVTFLAKVDVHSISSH